MAPNTLVLHSTFVQAVKCLFEAGKITFAAPGQNITGVSGHISITSRQGLSKIRELKMDPGLLERCLGKVLPTTEIYMHHVTHV